MSLCSHKQAFLRTLFARFLGLPRPEPQDEPARGGASALQRPPAPASQSRRCSSFVLSLTSTTAATTVHTSFLVN